MSLTPEQIEAIQNQMAPSADVVKNGYSGAETRGANGQWASGGGTNPSATTSTPTGTSGYTQGAPASTAAGSKVKSSAPTQMSLNEWHTYTAGGGNA